MHHHLHNHERTINLSIRNTSGSGKVCVLSQIKPQIPRLVVSLRQYFQVSVLQPYSPQGLEPSDFSDHAIRELLGWRYRLGRGIKRSLIVVYPHAFALDQLEVARALPPPSSVLAGSSYFTCPRRIRTASRPHLVSSHHLLERSTRTSWGEPVYSSWDLQRLRAL